jgi:D-alanyl-D-alanine carboxypeptidase
MPQQGFCRAAALGLSWRGAIAALLAAVVIGPLPAAARQLAADCGSASRVFEALVLDAETGRVLRAANPDFSTQPASLTKMMTLYLTFEALNTGRLRIDQALPVSSEAASRAPTKLGLVPGDRVVVRDLILGLVTRSANDAATVLAEALAGSEPAFADLMTAKARQLGMMQTVYHNASGLPDPEQRTTARDTARLALALYQHFPREYRYFATREFEFRGEIIKTHNHLLEWYEGADGIKTGFVHASGFNLAASAVRNGHRLIAVIMGGDSAHGRDEIMADLLDKGFADIGAGPAIARNQAPAPAAPMPVIASAAVAATAAAANEPAQDRVGLAGKVARAVGHLSPVSRAEAAPLTRETPEPTGEWSIQLGAFRSEAAAEQATQHAVALAVARGKQQEVLQPGHRERNPLYRARLYPFTSKAAQAACAALRKKGMECTVIRPTTHLASR